MVSGAEVNRRPAVVGWLLLVALLLPGLLLIGSSLQAAERDRAAELVGVWRLDRQVSDDPERELSQARLRLIPGDDAEASERLEQLQRRLTVFLDRIEILTIAWAEPVFTFTYWDEQPRALTLGAKTVEQRPEGPVEVKVSWKSSDRLVVKTGGLADGWTRESYELGGRGDKLFVTIELQRRGSKVPFSFERLYNRAPAAE